MNNYKIKQEVIDAEGDLDVIEKIMDRYNLELDELDAIVSRDWEPPQQDQSQDPVTIEDNFVLVAMLERLKQWGLPVEPTSEHIIWPRPNTFRIRRAGKFYRITVVPHISFLGTQMHPARIFWCVRNKRIIPTSKKLVRQCGESLCVNPDHFKLEDK